VNLCRMAFMFLIAAIVAMAMKVVGILLITALLIIPAATARQHTRTPESMALVAAGFGVLSVIGGLSTSLTWDTPTGPSIVLNAAILFALSIGVQSYRKLKHQG
jgi:zinc transport system permease protein